MSLLIISPPRSGSSIVAQLVENAGLETDKIKENQIFINPSIFNKNGYNEDVCFTLLNDQIIRCIYGNEFSFIHAPHPLKIKELFSIENFDLRDKIPQNYEYDLSEETIFKPQDYEKNIKKYCGCEWDVWGLTRMEKEKKWYRAYSKFNVSNKEEILIKFNQFQEKLRLSKNYYLKDPRLIFALPAYWNFIKLQKNIKIIYIQRNPIDTLKSMRAHYGNRIFTKKYIKNTKIVSNHFNYQIKSQSINEYFQSCIITKNFIKSLGDNHLVIDYDNLVDKRKSLEEIRKLEKFLNIKINSDLVKRLN